MHACVSVEPRELVKTGISVLRPKNKTHTKRKPSGLGFPSIRIKGAFQVARAAILLQRLAWNTLADRWPDTQVPSRDLWVREESASIHTKAAAPL